jgi:hypothetical protein
MKSRAVSILSACVQKRMTAFGRNFRSVMSSANGSPHRAAVSYDTR